MNKILTKEEVLNKLGRTDTDNRTDEQLTKILKECDKRIILEDKLHKQSVNNSLSIEAISRATGISKDTIYKKPILKDAILQKQNEYDNRSDFSKNKILNEENLSLKKRISSLEEQSVTIVDLTREINELKRKLESNYSIAGSFSILSWNMNGFRSRKDNLSSIINRNSPDIICLQEIRTDTLIDIPGYIKKANFGERKGYAGVAIYSKDNPINTKNYFEDEGRIILEEFNDFILINIYAPYLNKNKITYRNNFDQKLLSLIKEVNKPTICCGDFNCAYGDIDRINEDTKIPCQTIDEIKNFNNYILAGFKDSFRYLYPDMQGLTANESMRLDYFLTKDIKLIKESHLEYNGSDHRPIILTIDRPSKDDMEFDKNDETSIVNA